MKAILLCLGEERNWNILNRHKELPVIILSFCGQ